MQRNQPKTPEWSRRAEARLKLINLAEESTSSSGGSWLVIHRLKLINLAEESTAIGMNDISEFNPRLKLINLAEESTPPPITTDIQQKKQ